MTILAIGPRELPKSEKVEVWFDAGSSGTGQRTTVDARRLTLSERDQGEGPIALYEYKPHDYAD